MTANTADQRGSVCNFFATEPGEDGIHAKDTTSAGAVSGSPEVAAAKQAMRRPVWLRALVWWSAMSRWGILSSHITRRRRRRHPQADGGLRYAAWREIAVRQFENFIVERV